MWLLSLVKSGKIVGIKASFWYAEVRFLVIYELLGAWNDENVHVYF